MDDDWGVALFQDTPTKKRNITRRYQEMDCEDIYSFNMFKKKKLHWGVFEMLLSVFPTSTSLEVHQGDSSFPTV